MATAPITVDQALDIAVSCFKNGQYEEVIGACEEILRAEPANVHALHLRALSHANCANLVQAIADLKQALIIRPNDFELLNNLGNFYKASGQLDEAHAHYIRALEQEPQCHPALFNLGNIHMERGEWEEAQQVYLQAIELEPTFADAHYNLGLVFTRLGQMEDALASFKKCIARDTNHVRAQVEIGNCYNALGQTDQALNAYKVASIVDPDIAETFNNIAVVYIEQGKYADAQNMVETALRLDPGFSAARNNLGVVQLLQGQFELAGESFSEVVAGNPEHAPAYRNLGKCLAAQGEFDEAILTYRASLRFDPDAIDTQVELAAVYAQAGYARQAQEIFEQMQVSRPDSFVPVWGKAMAALPRFYSSPEAVAQARQEFERLLCEAENKLTLESPEAIADALFAISLLQPDNMRFQPGNNKALLARVGSLIGKIMQAQYPRYSQLLTRRAPDQDQPLRIGIVAATIPGVFAGLNQAKFEVLHYLPYGKSLEDFCEQVRRDQVHVLVYPRLDSAMTWQLAALRLAPVQCVTWEHGQTTGLATIDHFLGGELLEDASAQEMYLENLLRLPNLFKYYEQESTSGAGSVHAELRADSIRIFCGQPAENYLPAQDELFKQIAERLPNAQFVFQGPSPFADATAQRLAVDAVVIREPFDPTQMHLFLDSISLNDFDASIKCVEAGLPLLTVAGNSLANSCSAAILKQIDVLDTVAESSEALVNKVVSVAQDAELRNKISKRLGERKHWAYRDQEAVSGLEAALVRLS